MKYKYKKKNKFNFFILLFLTFVIVFILFMKYIPNFKTQDFFNYYNLNKNEYIINFKHNLFENKIKEINNIFYLNIDFLKENIDKYIQYENDKIVITENNEVLRFQIDNLNYTKNNKNLILSSPLIKIENKIFIPQDIIEEIYKINFNINKESKIVNLNDFYDSLYEAEITKKTNLRFENNIKSFIIKKLQKDENIKVFYDENNENDFVKIINSNGFSGYIKNKNINLKNKIIFEEKKSNLKINKNKNIKKVNLVWDVVSNIEANLKKQFEIKKVNVISPTWFSFDSKKLDGTIISYGDKNYVQRAHLNNYQVWALISDNFDYEVSSKILSSIDKRQFVINQLINFISIYNLDGINIDFEAIKKEDADFYISFLRELYPILNDMGVYLSVDMYLPYPWNLHYNQFEVSKTSDFVIIMAYDEHTRNSEKSGPVASINFVENGIKNSLKDVPKEKLILGLPFYTRVWREKQENGKTTHTIKNYGMQQAFNIFNQNKANIFWDEQTAYNYGEYEKIENNEKVTYKAWLEDENSIKRKLDLYYKYELAGIAGWRKGFEKKEIWDLVK